MSNVIYFIQRESDGAVKIGTTMKLKMRLSSLARKHGNLLLLGVISGSHVREKVLHWCFRSDRLDGEFFRPAKELLELVAKHTYIPDSIETVIICPKTHQAEPDNINETKIANKFLVDAIKNSGMTKADVARAMSVTPQAVGSLINTDFPRPDTLARFLLACGWGREAIRALSLADVYQNFMVCNGEVSP